MTPLIWLLRVQNPGIQGQKLQCCPVPIGRTSAYLASLWAWGFEARLMLGRHSLSLWAGREVINGPCWRCPFSPTIHGLRSCCRLRRMKIYGFLSLVILGWTAA